MAAEHGALGAAAWLQHAERRGHKGYESLELGWMEARVTDVCSSSLSGGSGGGCGRWWQGQGRRHMGGVSSEDSGSGVWGEGGKHGEHGGWDGDGRRHDGWLKSSRLGYGWEGGGWWNGWEGGGWWSGGCLGRGCLGGGWLDGGRWSDGWLIGGRWNCGVWGDGWQGGGGCGGG